MNKGDVLIKSGRTMPLGFVSLNDFYHVLLKSKAEMDQFVVGLAALGVLDAVRVDSDI